MLAPRLWAARPGGLRLHGAEPASPLSLINQYILDAPLLQELGFEFDGERAEWLRWFNEIRAFRWGGAWSGGGGGEWGRDVGAGRQSMLRWLLKTPCLLGARTAGAPTKQHEALLAKSLLPESPAPRSLFWRLYSASRSVTILHN